jgi:hypothetical protein
MYNWNLKGRGEKMGADKIFEKIVTVKLSKNLKSWITETMKNMRDKNKKNHNETCPRKTAKFQVLKESNKINQVKK